MTNLAQPAIVLVRPQMGENIGAAARAMFNFGLEHMRVVGPRDGWPNERAVAMASGAGRLLDEAKLCDTLPEALDDRTWVAATTARPRGLSKPVLTPEEAVAEAVRRIGEGGRVAFMFGPERAGLENEDIAQANAIVSVPVNPEFPSLNLAQCVLLLSYEWRKAAHGLPEQPQGDAPDIATVGEVEALARHYEERLEEAGFFFPEEKAGHMRRNLRNLWSRMPLQRGDVQILHGIMRQMVRWKERGGGS